jgi:hypothetical protein
VDVVIGVLLIGEVVVGVVTVHDMRRHILV